MLDKQLWKMVSDMNEKWKQKSLQLPSQDHLRTSLSKEGSFEKILRIEPQEVASFFNDCAMFAVDGSSFTYGGNYPYRITFLRAMSQCIDSRNKSEYVLSHVVSPLNEEDEQAVRDYVLLRPDKKSLQNEESAFEEWKNKQLARLEIEAAIKAVKEAAPKLILFDGGFLRYEGADPELWHTYKELSKEAGTISVGVIEEVGTNELTKKLIESGSRLPGNFRDRELMYGLMEPGEWFKLPLDTLLKRHFYTCFARFSHDPQVIGLDIFSEHLSELEFLVRLLSSFTPKKTRGIPLPIDLVDEKVRVRKEEVELLVNQYIDPGIHERLLNPMRTRRQY